MNASLLRQCVRLVCAVVLLGIPFFDSAWAIDTTRPTETPWDGDSRAAMRLVAGAAVVPGGGPLRAGVELRLAPGWKTYWRYPGDSGVPPTLDFSKSENVESVTILWPAPHRFTDEGGASIGYKGSVLLPLRVTPHDPRQPVRLNLALDYAICGKLCIPASAAATLPLGAAASPHDRALAAAEALVPAPSRLGDGAALAIRSVRRVPGEPLARVEVDVAAPAAGTVDLFVEGPAADWALPLPEPMPGPAAGAPAGVRRFAFALDGLPPGATSAGAALRFTLVSGDKAIEVTAVVD